MATRAEVKVSMPSAEFGGGVEGAGSGGRIRTTDQGLMSPLLYH
jgi:hypothetical protein